MRAGDVLNFVMLLVKEVSILISISLFAAAASDQDKLAEACNDYGLALMKTFPEHGNVFFSPFSSYIALNIAYEGARRATRKEIRDVLRLNKVGFDNAHRLLAMFDSDKYMEIANVVLSQVDDQVLPKFKEHLKSYNALFKEVELEKNGDEQDVKEINDWVKQKTNGKIPEIVQTLSQDAKMVILNAIYFKGIWEHTFDTYLTRNEIFYNDGTDNVSVPMMRILEKFPHYADKEIQVVELPYKGEDKSMVILLPNSYDKLKVLAKNINSEYLRDILSKLRTTNIDVRIPKFKLEDVRRLRENLESLGMLAAFSNDADFSGISEENQYHISDIIHKSSFEINEEGSEAATITALILGLRSAFLPEQPPIFQLNRPFLFFVKHRETNLILFMGRVTCLSHCKRAVDDPSLKNLTF